MFVTVKHVQKVLEKVPASDVSKKVEYLLNTGNLVSQSGLDLNQVCSVGNLAIHQTIGKAQTIFTTTMLHDLIVWMWLVLVGRRFYSRCREAELPSISFSFSFST